MGKAEAGRGVAGKHMSPDGFRLDINALRALSVIAVVGFHFQIPGFAGGFVGVDVFLVITGYLMTTKVLNELKLGRFSLWTFCHDADAADLSGAGGRGRLASVVIGWFVTLPGEYLKHLLQALSALAFVSNFAFNSDSGYFAMAAQTKPLLHTWSLSLEWQFYLWMPLIAWLVWRLASRATSGIRAVTIALQVFAALSLACCLWASQHDAMGSSFFSLRARAWEPLAGGLIAAAEIRRRSEGAKASWLESPVLALAGWALVVGCTAYPLARSALARHAHDSADPGRGHDRRGPTGGGRGRPAWIITGPAHRRLVLFDLPVALADLGVRAELAGGARLRRRQRAKDHAGAGLAGARRALLPLCRAAGPDATRFLDAAPAADSFQRLVCSVRRLRVAGIPEPWFSRKAAGLSAAG